MKFKFVILIMLSLTIILIHINSLTLPHSILARHIVLILFVSIAGYIAYESRRRQLEEIAKLNEFLILCSWCNKVRIRNSETNEEMWVSIEKYMTLEYKKKSSHGICPECYSKHIKDEV